MSTFVEECRQEWKRLGVPDLLADEMAQDLAADLAEAESDGVSASEILGESDPRRFAATWALERGLVPEGAPKRSRRARRPIFVACGLIVVAAAISLPLGLTGTGATSHERPLHARFFVAMYQNSIECEVLPFQGTHAPIKGKGQELFCESDWALGRNGGGRKQWVWAIAETGDTLSWSSIPAPVLPQPPTLAELTLRVGRDWSRGAFTCESRSTGVTCRNSSQHGFTLGKKREQTF